MFGVVICVICVNGRVRHKPENRHKQQTLRYPTVYPDRLITHCSIKKKHSHTADSISKRRAGPQRHLYQNLIRTRYVGSEEIKEGYLPSFD
ncbi:hypothetical protein M408DRAFT_291717 [Serendipita vermifera MAFF 305830]|uniref:Uncharacterized protein n=1 Tax=Serendipita vermifera MAFF 305830 TaxID=933852 RepID=A0A0C2WY96_SERVB|nr:hypothetical protein M408DRAFT_291717 [Serendipita vermifera MAFF 305830]